jgi:hypothetical protein
MEMEVLQRELGILILIIHCIHVDPELALNEISNTHSPEGELSRALAIYPLRCEYI